MSDQYKRCSWAPRVIGTKTVPEFTDILLMAESDDEYPVTVILPELANFMLFLTQTWDQPVTSLLLRQSTPPMLTSTSLKIDCFLPFSKSQTASESCDDSFAPWLTSSFQYGSRPTTHPHLTYDQCPSGLPVPSRVSPPTDYTSESWSLKSVTNMLLASI